MMSYAPAGGEPAQAEPSDSAYGRVAQDLRDALLSERFPPGAQLPTEAELAEEYRVSRHTIRRAFHDLVTEGLVDRVRGRGTFASGRDDGGYLRQLGSIEDLMGLSADTSVQVLSGLSRRVDVGIAGRLRLDSDTVYGVSFTRIHEGVVFCVTMVWLPPNVAQLLDDVAELRTPGEPVGTTVLALLDTRLKDPVAEADQSITVEAADSGRARVLGVEAGTPLLRVDRVYFDTLQRPVELAVSSFLPDQYSYRVNLRRGNL
jgi:DNA-binding GntR family transcriptional regulator